MCSLIGYHRDSYYKRLSRAGLCLNTNEEVLNLVKEVRKDEPRTGTRKIHNRILPQLESIGLKIGRDKLFKVLRESSMLVKRKKSFSKTTYSNHSYAVAPNRYKNLEVQGAQEVFVSDITYLRTKSGFVYLFLVTDVYSRKIVGYHVSKDLSHYSAIIALSKALKEIDDARGIIHHSDRGVQYCCHDFLSFLGSHGMVASMTDDNHCYQNAIAERVNGILKDEFDLDATFESLEQVKGVVDNAIWVYNNKRTHWSLGLKTPVQVHLEAA